MRAADLGPIPRADRTQPAFDLFLIFVGANIVATTMQVGASLASAFDLRVTLTMGGGRRGGRGAPGGAPSVIAARAALGIRGAAAVALGLYLSNFAWIAVNNVIAASACARV